MKEKLVEIIKLAVRAPSGDNKQPWRFEMVGEDAVLVYNKPEADKSLYNYEQYASYIAIGCLLFNIEVIAKQFSLGFSEELFPSPDDSNLVASLVFIENQSNESKYFESIKLRATNRFPFLDKLLPEDFKHEISSISGVKLIENKEQMQEFGKLVAVNEIVLLENKIMHDSFFEDMVWTTEEEKTRKEGLSFDTMALKGPAAFMFKRFRSWGFLNFMNKFSIAKKVAEENSKSWGSGSGVFAVTSDLDSSKDAVNSGKIFEECWLLATKYGLAFQPVSGVIFLARRILKGDKTTFNEEHQKLILDTYSKLGEIFKVRPEELRMVFRIGFGPDLQIKTSRKDPEISYK